MISGYLDPASGSAIMSAVVAGSAGAVVAGKTLMARMRFKKRPAEESDDDALAADEEATTADVADAEQTP